MRELLWELGDLAGRRRATGRPGESPVAAPGAAQAGTDRLRAARGLGEGCEDRELGEQLLAGSAVSGLPARLEAAKLLDFDDLILQLVRLLELAEARARL